MIRINEKEKKILVSSKVGLEDLAEIIDRYRGYTIYIGDEFDENTDIEW
jgi:hypothetical protein